MKRLSAIFLLGLVLYNAFGYHLLLAYEKHQARQTAILHTPESYFKVIKIKVALYTSISDTDFEYVDEELRLENQVYHIVKKRIKNDTAELYYFRNFHQESLTKKSFQFLNNLSSASFPNSNNPLKNLLKAFLKDYVPIESNYEFFDVKKGCLEFVCRMIPFEADRMPFIFQPILTPPPECLS
ncbi:MAG: hypothetical protein SFV55_05190 [Haliscomenobacter sp.]|uniref:hypothetical protein n=1 Tax=Haliscomenobacter sp. TaxID=2717303 RepID=UPI0029BC16F8|nr:hypothetical protein [Haliscomenobacter sp.]MDX2067798.1 hypothetical protein [Haliscomenobacter sp.]